MGLTYLSSVNSLIKERFLLVSCCPIIRCCIFRSNKNETGFFKKPYSELKKEYKKLEATFNLWEGKKYKSNILKYKKDYDGYHPTQKPVELYRHLLNEYAEKGNKIFDSHLGSGSIAIACDELGFDLTACEIDKDYFYKANKRLNPYRKQQSLF